LFKNGIKTVCFVAVLGYLTMYMQNILEWKSSEGITQFYDYGENSMDVIVLGSSHAYCTVNTALLWDKYGMAAVNIGESGQNLGSTYYYMEEVLKYQQPQVMLVELRFLVGGDKGVGNGNLYRNTINMKWSGNFIDNMNYALAESGIEDTSEMGKFLFLKFPVYHSRYKEVTEDDFWPVSAGKGRYDGAWTSEEYEVPGACSVTESSQIDASKKVWLDRMKSLSEKYHFALVFFVAPYNLSVDQMKQFNAAKEYAGTNNIPYFNFNELYEEIGFCYSTDMRSENHAGSHLNNYGAAKVTNSLGEFLHQTYNLADHRGERRYMVYDRISQNWSKKVANHDMEEAENLEQYVALLDKTEYDFAMLIYNNQTGILESLKEDYPEAADAMASDGLYATVGRQRNDIWNLSKEVLLEQGDGGAETVKVYSDKVEQTVTGADMAVIVVDKESGKLVNISKFSCVEDQKSGRKIWRTKVEG